MQIFKRIRYCNSKLITICLLMLSLSGISFAEKRPEIQDIAFGLRDGKVILLNINTLSTKKFNTKVIPNSLTIGIAYFSECNKLVFDVFGGGQKDERAVGIINLNTNQVDYWDTAKLGLGTKINDVALSQSDSMVIIGKFAERNSYQVPAAEYKEFEKTIKAALYKVCNDSWIPLSEKAQPNYKIYSGRLDHPLLRKKYKRIWEKLKAQRLIPETAKWNALIWLDENYVLFRSGESLVIGRFDGTEINIYKKMDVKSIKAEADLLHPDSVVFIYNSK